MTRGMILRADQEALFNIYLKIFFGDPKTSLNAGSFANMQKVLKAQPELKKLQFPEYEIQTVRSVYQVPDVLRDYINGLSKSAGQLRANLLMIDSNYGYWHELLQKTWWHERPVSRFTKKLSERILRRWIPDEVRRELADSKRDHRSKILQLARILEQMIAALQKSERPYMPIAHALVDLVHASGFANTHYQELLRSSDALKRLDGLQKALDDRDALSMELGYSGHFREFLDKYNISSPTIFSLNLSYPHPKNPKHRLSKPFTTIIELMKKLEREIRKGTPNLTPTEITRVRSLSITESSFRSFLGGSDCSSRTYFDKAFDPNFYYFTMTDTQHRSSGHITVVLGTAVDRNQNQVQIAYIDKIQNVPNSVLPNFLEAIRQSVAERGYLLALPSSVGDHNGLSNMETTRAFVHSQILPTLEQTLSGFTPHPHAYSFDNGHSTAYSKPNVMIVKPQEVHEGTVIRRGVQYEPWLAPVDLTPRSLAQETLALKDSSKDEDKLKFIYSGDTIKSLAQLINFDTSIYQEVLKEFLGPSRKNSFVVRKAALLQLVTDTRADVNLFQKYLIDSFETKEMQSIVSEVYQWQKSTNPKFLEFFKLLRTLVTEPIRVQVYATKGVRTESENNGLKSLEIFEAFVDWEMIAMIAADQGHLAFFREAHRRLLNAKRDPAKLVELLYKVTEGSIQFSSAMNEAKFQIFQTVLQNPYIDINGFPPSSDQGQHSENSAVMLAIKRASISPTALEEFLKHPGLNLVAQHPTTKASALTTVFTDLRSEFFDLVKPHLAKVSRIDKLKTIHNTFQLMTAHVLNSAYRQSTEGRIKDLLGEATLLDLAKLYLSLNLEVRNELHHALSFFLNTGILNKLFKQLAPDQIFDFFQSNSRILEREWDFSFAINWSFEQKLKLWTVIAVELPTRHDIAVKFFDINFKHEEIPVIAFYTEDQSGNVRESLRKALSYPIQKATSRDGMPQIIANLPTYQRIEAINFHGYSYEEIGRFWPRSEIENLPYEQRHQLSQIHPTYVGFLNEQELDTELNSLIDLIYYNYNRDADEWQNFENFESLFWIEGETSDRVFALLSGLELEKKQALTDTFLNRIALPIQVSFLFSISTSAVHNKNKILFFRILKNVLRIRPDLINKRLGGSAGYYFLHQAASRLQLDAVKYLLERGANANLFDNEGRPPAYLAALEFMHRGMEEDIEIAREITTTIIQSGGTIALDMGFKGNILHRAARYGYNSVIKLIMENGGDPHERNSVGLTAFEVAERAKNTEGLQLLRETRRVYFPNNQNWFKRVFGRR